MRMIASLLLLGALCHLGLGDSSTPDGKTTVTLSTGQTTSPGVDTTSPGVDTTSPGVNPTASTTVAASTAGPTTQTPAPTSAETATTGNLHLTVTTATVVTSSGAVATTVTETPGTVATATATASTTAGPSPTTVTNASVTEATTGGQTTQTQPQLSPQFSTALSSTASAAASPSAQTPTENSTETATAEGTLPTAPSTEASTSTSQTVHNPAGAPQGPQTQSPSTASTTVTVSGGAPAPGGETTTSKDTNVPRNETHPVVYVKGKQKDEGHPVAFKVCEELMQKMQVDTCTLDFNPNGTIKKASVEVNPAFLKKLEEKHNQTLANAKAEQKDEEEAPKNTTLIAILCSCGALLAMTAGFIAYITCHRKSYRKNQQHLTEELQTVENGYHDNPTLEVMEVHPEMQEKKTALHSEFSDSWIVPFDTLAKDDGPEEEDTHL